MQLKRNGIRDREAGIRDLCAKYGIPYVQEGVFSRVKKVLSIAIGSSSMKRARNVGKRADETLSVAAE